MKISGCAPSHRHRDVVPDLGAPTTNRFGPDRRSAAASVRGDDLEGGGRQRDYHIEAAAWAVMGALVVLYLFFAVLGAIDPTEAPFATFVVVLLALGWLSHAWERLYRGGHVSRSDRERRGF